MGFGSSGNFSDVNNTAYLSLVVNIGLTEVQAKVGSSNLANRQELIIFNDSLNTIYYGPSGVTTSGPTKGIPINGGGFVNLPFGADVSVFLIAASATNSVIIQELA